MTGDDDREWNDPPGASSPGSTSGSGDVRVGVVVLGAWLLTYAAFLAYQGEHSLSLSALAIVVLLYVAVTYANVLAVWLAALVGGVRS